MEKTLVEKAQNILDGIEIGFFDTAKRWDKDNYDDYYKYFTHPNFEVRKYALLIFGAGLGNWLIKSSFIFQPIEKGKIELGYLSDKNEVYNFEDYVRSFIENREAIKQEFPNLYNSIASSLTLLDNENRFESIFTSVDKQLFIKLRKVLADSEPIKHQYRFNDILREVRLPTFLKD